MPVYRMPDGEHLFVREFGRGHPVLVLSGLGMQSWQWLPFLHQERKQFQFIIPDWRGFGGSKNCDFPQHLDAIHSHWRDIECLIQQRDLQKFILIGYSMGATTAMHGMQHSSLVQKLQAYLHIDQSPKIVSDADWPYGLFGRRQAEFKTLLAEMLALLTQYQGVRNLHELALPLRQELLELWLKFIRLQNSNTYSPALLKLAIQRPRLQKYLLPIQRLDYLRWYVENYLYHHEDYREVLTRLECSTTFFIGRQSNLYAAQGQKIIAERTKNARSVYFEHSGHTPLLTEPGKFRREIQHFLQPFRT